MVFFIADTHFGHKNVLKLCNRPFETIEQMNETFIENWNRRVTGRDSVYVIGDLFFRCEDPEAPARPLQMTLTKWQKFSFSMLDLAKRMGWE